MLAKTLIFTLLLTSLPLLSAADNRIDDLNREIDRQEQTHWQEQMNLKFNQLKNHFTGNELKQMEESGTGIELTRLSPDQSSGLHNLLATALTPLGYLRATSLIGLQGVHREMGKAGDPGFLQINQMDGMQELVLMSSTFSITLKQEGDTWAVTSFYMGHWPRQISEAPQPDLSRPEIHYPYTRWNESVGISPLGQTARLAIRVINELPSVLKKKACLNVSRSDMNCPLKSINMNSSEGITLDDLTAQGRHLVKMLILQLRGHLDFTETSDLAGIRLSWAGDLPLLYHTGHNKDLLVNLMTVTGKWQIIMTGTNPSESLDMLPENALMVRFINDSMADMTVETLPRIAPIAPEPSIVSNNRLGMNTMKGELTENQDNQITDVTLAGTDDADSMIAMDDDSDIIWLKDPAFLSDLALSIGYLGDRISTRAPFIPVVRVKKDGRAHKNIRVSITLQEKGSDPWLENLPLVFHPESQDYRATVHLPATIFGEQLMIKFSVHEPGTRFEGLYDYTVKVGTRDIIPAPPNF
ncbi:DUF3500 domain-containing protein [Sansalvadorimonas sp. 2012CJ34-2]|uniref:DUF3500 domain-containing protein n=1 Tax=Parendozoicomonas callyspongiae TaxID=2942213 RepID=A0ABT0PG43_9GAMM|nr:DUF3500 domain-containing protein [Sansalvadorimonas sp. 2012CJ34-2]MCL6270348.1 DUF3500 domain-containing protein [Sansalvadorimonas sp. 2012CJ34-2]